MQPFGFGISSGGVYTYTGNGPFANGGIDTVVMPDARLAAIKSAGFAFVRMAIDPGVLCAAPNDATLDSLNQQIVAGIARRRAQGLKVVVDIHVLPHHPVAGWSYNELVDGPSGPKMSRLKYVVSRLAAAMWAVHTTTCPEADVCVELYNEPRPAAAFTPTPYTAQIKDYWAAVRAVCGYTLVVGGSNLNALDGLPSGDNLSGLSHLPASDYDANTSFAYHAYEPAVFTHQGVAGTIYEDMHGLTWPVTDYPGGRAKAESDFTASANAGGRQANIAPVVTNTTWWSSLAKAFSTLGSKPLLAARQAVATGWADAAGVSRRRVFCTETGVSFGKADTLGTVGDATVTSAAAFLQSMRENAETGGLGCLVVHEVQGSDFKVQQSSAPWAITPEIKAALFPAGAPAMPNTDPPSAVGSYTVTAVVTDPNYMGQATGTLVLSKSAAQVTLGALTQTYDGTPKPVTVTTTPPGLAVAVTYQALP